MIFGLPVLVVDDLVDAHTLSQIQDRAGKIYNEVEPSGHDWMCDVYSTCHDYNLLRDQAFESLHDAMCRRVNNDFLNKHGILDTVIPSGSWLNAYSSEQYQEQHKHPNNWVSAVYFLDAPEGSAPLTFHNPNLSDLSFNKQKWTHLLEFKNYDAVTNRLIVFLSHTPHSVGQGTNEELRFTVATNYVLHEET